MILDDRVAGGVIIHENRFTYQAKGLVCIADLGKKWEEKTGLPIPLGGIFAHKRLPSSIVEKMEKLIRESIHFANNHPDVVMPYVRRFAQEMDDDVMRSHIDLYVNEYSLSLGKTGFDAVEALKIA
jgi:1,4-dihydroxy-6-naphthoate synthase